LDGRVASPAGGAGLGLSIVRSVARTHGDAHARALPDGGLEVTARLPAPAKTTMAIPPLPAALPGAR
jgi:signal transduction histidine kinase